MLPKCPTKYVDDPIGPPIYLYAAFRQHISYYLHILDLQILFKSELETTHYQSNGAIFDETKGNVLMGSFKYYITPRGVDGCPTYV